MLLWTTSKPNPASASLQTAACAARAFGVQMGRHKTWICCTLIAGALDDGSKTILKMVWLGVGHLIYKFGHVRHFGVRNKLFSIDVKKEGV